MLGLDDISGDYTVREILEAKHPPPAPASMEALLDGDAPPTPHPTRFSGLDRETVQAESCP